MTPEQFERKWIFFRAAGLGQEWEQAATVAAASWDSVRYRMHVDAGQKLDEFEGVNPMSFIPGRGGQPKETRQQTPQEMEAIAKSLVR